MNPTSGNVTDVAEGQAACHRPVFGTVYVEPDLLFNEQTSGTFSLLLVTLFPVKVISVPVSILPVQDEDFCLISTVCQGFPT